MPSRFTIDAKPLQAALYRSDRRAMTLMFAVSAKRRKQDILGLSMILWFVDQNCGIFLAVRRSGNVVPIKFERIE